MYIHVYKKKRDGKENKERIKIKKKKNRKKNIDFFLISFILYILSLIY